MVTRKTAAAPRKTAKTAKTAKPQAAAPRRAAPRRRASDYKPLDLVLLGATGFTGRQAVRAVLRQRPDARWAVAGRDAAKLQALVDQRVPAGARPPKIIVADTRDPDALRAMARQTKVVFNLAGPYHATGDAVVVIAEEAGSGVVKGELLASGVHEIAVRRRSERAGELVVHFPREDYLVIKAG